MNKGEVRVAIAEHDELFIGNRWVPSDAKGRIDVRSASTEEVIGRVPDATKSDVDRAVAAAREAFDKGPFPRMAPEERADAIRRLSEALKKRAPAIAEVISRQNGCPTRESVGTQVFAATMVLDIHADMTKSFNWSEERPGAFGNPVRVGRLPVGVCAGIIPWNVPLFIMAMKLGPALAAGCTVVLKPSPETPLDPYLLGEAILEAELPPGVVNIVAAGRETSEYLVSHPGVDKVSFTGSSATGRRVASLAGEGLKRCTLELGGKSAAILLDDFDLESHGAALLSAGLLNNGQACAAQTRILAPRSRYKEIVEGLGALVAAKKVGDAMDPATEIGPLVAERQRDRVLGYLEDGKKAGARAVCGGGRPRQLPKGWFIEPTLFADVDNAMKIAREEIFGPVLCVIPYDGDDQAIAIANDSPYGLSGSVWSQDVDRAAKVASQLRTGTVPINSPMLLDFRSPFGGFKQSGIGRELGPEGIAPFTEYRSIILPPRA
jgi:aldehyde dehydrogenase (NAD+)